MSFSPSLTFWLFCACIRSAVKRGVRPFGDLSKIQDKFAVNQLLTMNLQDLI